MMRWKPIELPEWLLWMIFSPVIIPTFLMMIPFIPIALMLGKWDSHLENRGKHQWFAWRPIRVWQGHWVWGVKVMRERHCDIWIYSDDAHPMNNHEGEV
jgi:hypothetical protein